MTRKKKPNKRNQKKTIQVSHSTLRNKIEELRSKKKNCSIEERKEINKQIRQLLDHKEKLREEVSISDTKPRKYPQYTISYPQHRINNWTTFVSVPFGGQKKK